MPQRHPGAVLFSGEKPFPILPAVDHYAGAEKLIRKALQLQRELGNLGRKLVDRFLTSPATAKTAHAPAPNASTQRCARR
jgi:hypothetical protein